MDQTKSTPTYEYLRDVHRVTEYRDGCVYATEFVEQRWVDSEKYSEGDLLFITPKLVPGRETIRRKA